MENLDRPLQELKGIGEKRLQALNKAGLFSYADLAMRYPTEYRQYDHKTILSQALPGSRICCEAVVGKVRFGYYGGMSIVSTVLTDGTGRLEAVWYNQPYIRSRLTEGEKLAFYGLVAAKDRRIRLINPSIMKCEEAVGLEAVYRPLAGFPQKTYRECAWEAVEWVAENREEPPLPGEIAARYSLMPYYDAMRAAHRPESLEEITQSRRTLSFYELLMYQLALMSRKKVRGKARPLTASDQDLENFRRLFPFPFTGAQERAMEEIRSDLAKDVPMARLLQGDVGSGKTAVAFYALYLCLMSGCQGALMAPTEILARQHFESALPIFSALGYRVCCLTGSLKASEKKAMQSEIAQGKVDLIIGTHALVMEKVSYRKLGLVVCDEQHRFGVNQRLALEKKAMESLAQEEGTAEAHTLVMSATPIPRTLALILYCDLDLSVLDEMPPGRRKVNTYLVGDEKREDMYAFCRKQIDDGNQIYVVCPLVSDSEEIPVKSVQSVYKQMCEKMAPHSVAMLHGQMSGEKKQDIIHAFANGDIKVLVATTVIEVGINVPQVTVMIIEDADRFGLSQLHQLRGRVGRSSLQSYCFLMAQSDERLRTMCRTNDGFQIAEKDLELRGPGELIGTRQSGALDPRIAFLTNQIELLTQTNALARELIQNQETGIIRYAGRQYEKQLEETAMN